MGSDCCSGEEKNVGSCGGQEQKDCCSAPEVKPTPCASGCCAGDQPAVPSCCAGGEDDGQSACCEEETCSPANAEAEAAPQVGGGCCGGAGGCCASGEAEKKADEAADKALSIASSAAGGCCSDCGDGSDSSSDTAGGQADEKAFFSGPCTERCDEKCIVAVAAVECEKACSGEGKDDGVGHEHVHNKDGHHPSSACSMHLRSAFDKYSSYLETARCICRSVLDVGLPMTKCTNGYENAPAPAATRGSASASSSAPKPSAHSTSTAYHGQGAGACGGGQAKGNMKQRTKKPAQVEASGCCSTQGGASTCQAAAPAKALPPASKPVANTQAVDVESGGPIEHVTLTVDGMTCSGCAAKLERTLKGASPGVSGVSANFVMGTAELDVDTSAAIVDDLVRHAERATGFRLLRIESGDQSLDLLVSGPSALRALQDAAIPGLIQVQTLDKKTARVSYDPTVVGARQLLRRIGDLSAGLAPLRLDPSESSGRRRFWDLLAKTAAAAVFTIPVVVLAWGRTAIDHKTRSSVSIALATVVQLIAVPEFYRPALSALLGTGTIEMDMLVVISISAAYLYSVVAYGFRMAGRPLETAEFFETSTLLVTLVLLGRVVAAYARIRAVSAVSIRSLQPALAVLVVDDGEAEIDARLLQLGDRFRVAPHSRVPTDGRVVEGASEIDESMVTGESLPVAKHPGDDVVAGTVNGPGSLLVRLARLPGKNTVTDIAGMVEDAAKAKPKTQDLADRVAGYFVLVVCAIAVVVTAVWIAVSLAVRRESGATAVANAITYAVAVLAISCPCGIGLAVPMVLVVAGGIAARGGVVIKSADATEKALRVTDVVFDKTGTLTESSLEVVSEHFLVPDADAPAARAVAAALVRDNKHPVSAAIAKHLAATSTRPDASLVADIQTVPGAGVHGTSATGPVRGGSPEWAGCTGHPVVARILADKMTVFCVTEGDGHLLAAFGLKTRLRPEAAAVVAQLHARKITVHLVSGDHAGAVESVAGAVGIPPSCTSSRCTPAMKRDYVAVLGRPVEHEKGSNSGGSQKTVLFCGDGTNDAVAVAQADIGVQISGGGELAAGGAGSNATAGGGSDVTRGAADVVLLAGLRGIPFLLDVSRAAFRRVLFNLVWSAVYNLLAILLTAGAFVTVRIPPAYAGLGELVSVLPVILASMTMLAVKIRA